MHGTTSAFFWSGPSVPGGALQDRIKLFCSLSRSVASKGLSSSCDQAPTLQGCSQADEQETAPTSALGSGISLAGEKSPALDEEVRPRESPRSR